MIRRNVRTCVVNVCAAAGIAVTGSAEAQIKPTFSIDVQSVQVGGPGPFSGAPDGWFGTPLDEGSILTPALPGPPGANVPLPGGGGVPPGVMITAVNSGAGSVPGGLGIVPGVLGGAVELDALSYGHDLGLQLMFSVDEWAGGDPTAPPPGPNVFTEGALGALDASADVFVYNGPVVRTPTPFPGAGPDNRNVLDGDGFAPPALPLPALGLKEGMAPGCGVICVGDNLDALDVNTRVIDPFGPIYFSLDSGFLDPLDGVAGINTGTALANGFSGADILFSFAGGAPGLFAPGPALGLDLFGFGTDDLDALILIEDGDGVFVPSRDRVLFSVRRGSAVIGTPDSMFGIPIEEGDVLSLPTVAGAFPSIYITAEALGLATVRSGTVVVSNFGDELDALDLFLAGDLDGDGFVGINDLNIVLGNWNQPVPPANPDADVDGDGFVGIVDLNVVLGNWNAGAPLPPGGASVPEPGSLALLGLAGAVLSRTRPH